MFKKINYRILTNNKLVLKYYPDADYNDQHLLEVYIRARDLIHQGYRLLNHPLAGSVKPNHNPYRSLVLSAQPGEGLDFASLRAIENSIETVQKFLRDHPHPRWGESLLKDFRYIDLELLKSVISQ